MMTISVLNFDVFKLTLNMLTLSDCGRMCTVCTEWNQFMKDTAIWETLAKRVLREFPKAFNVPWRNWLQSPGIVDYSEFPGWLNFPKREIHVSWGLYGWEYMFNRILPGAVVVNLQEDGGKSEDIRFRCSIESKNQQVIRLNGEKLTTDESAWLALESLEKDPSVQKWKVVTLKN